MIAILTFIQYLIPVFLVFILIRIFKDYQKEKIENAEIKKRLESPLLYDPVTGTELTLEQAEKGTFIDHDNYNRTRTQKELDQYFDAPDRVIEEIANYLKINDYSKCSLDDEQSPILDTISITGKYNTFDCQRCYENLKSNFLVLFPRVYIESTRQRVGINGFQIMFWVSTTNLDGHYYMRPKTKTEGILDKIRNDDPFDIEDFEIFPIKETENILPLIRLLKRFEGLEDIEIEVKENNIFVKTLDEPTLEKFLKLEYIIKTFADTR